MRSFLETVEVILLAWYVFEEMSFFGTAEVILEAHRW